MHHITTTRHTQIQHAYNEDKIVQKSKVPTASQELKIQTIAHNSSTLLLLELPPPNYLAPTHLNTTSRTRPTIRTRRSLSRLPTRNPLEQITHLDIEQARIPNRRRI